MYKYIYKHIHKLFLFSLTSSEQIFTAFSRRSYPERLTKVLCHLLIEYILVQYSKTYGSAEEESRRKETWLANRKLVLIHNMLADQGIKSYRLGMTYFADMVRTPHRLLNGSHLIHNSAGGAVLPDTVDWRDKGYVTDVKDQKQCGSCWAFSATGALEGQTFRKAGKLMSLSEQQLVDCSGDYGNMGCGGGLMDQAFDYIKDNGGIDTEESYPYEAVVSNLKTIGTFSQKYSVAATCTGYVDITSGDEDALKEAVATIGPVSVAIDAGHSSFQLYDSGDSSPMMCSSTDLDHGVLVVGYGSDSGQVINWGIDWGQEGYIMMSRNKHNQCGITTASSYPLV
uniref:Cathepsin L.1 n=1 Tax=Electrophorus electricus TaxID=8005 RepID=A0AAY5EJE0_ELEEL